LAYASAYLKCHLPAVFAAAILNVQPMGFYSTEVLVNDARRHGVTIKPIEVNASEYWSHVEPDGGLRLGFHLVRGLGEVQRKRLEAAIEQGPFDDVLAFARRTQLERETLENLAISGAFAPWYPSRRAAMWALRGLDEREARGELGTLMDVDEPAVEFESPGPKKLVAFDLWATGVTPSGQVMEHFRELLAAERVVPAADLPKIARNALCRVGGLVITRQRPGTAKGFVFLTLEDETGIVNVIVRPDVYETYRRPIRSSSTLIVEGTLQKESGCIDVLAKKIWSFNDEGITGTIAVHSFQ
jgi:error-prone DNA polymerase